MSEVPLYVLNAALIAGALFVKNLVPHFFFFFISLKPRVESFKSLWALNTSPPRNRFTFLRSSCS